MSELDAATQALFTEFLTAEEIAERLAEIERINEAYQSPKTVAKHVANLNKKYVKLAKARQDTAAKAAAENARIEAAKAIVLPEPAEPKVITRLADLPTHVGNTVRVAGWATQIRQQGALVFFILRDGAARTQVVLSGDCAKCYAAIALTTETAVEIVANARGDERAPGGVELQATWWKPYEIAKSDYESLFSRDSSADILFDQRHLSVRDERAAEVLKVRAHILAGLRQHMLKTQTWEVTPPSIVSTAPEGSSNLFKLDYFGQTCFLTQSSQLYLEAAAGALRDVYCIAPSFRAEKSRTRRHLAEFTHCEAEYTFLSFDDLLCRIEAVVRGTLGYVLEHARESVVRARALELNRRVTDRVKETFPEALAAAGGNELSATEREALRAALTAKAKAEVLEIFPALPTLPDHPFRRLKHAEAIDMLNQHGITRPDGEAFTHEDDIEEAAERRLIDMLNEPVFLTHFPRRIKAFYMSEAKDQTVPDCEAEDRETESADLLMPGIGEIVGGSMRIWDIATIEKIINDDPEMDPVDYAWYCDLRRYGAAPHGGFGLGLERLVVWLCGLYHIRDSCWFPRYRGRVTP